ncbi:glycosyltransferase 61 family protein [Ruegeria sp.]|uniref:glycosyltransferase 61 family protein n=1 Tax=Ruegeria sp. TaxID=1879320 RepID=UPI003B5A2E5C
MTNPVISGPATVTLKEEERSSRTERPQAFYRPDGRVMPNGDIVSGQLSTPPCQTPPAQPGAKRVQGPVLFAGLALEQFGHVLINSLGRLWALQHLPPETRLLFIPKRSEEPEKYRHTASVLRWLGFSGEFLLARTDTTFEELYTCPDIFGERYGGQGLPGFYTWLDGRLPVAQDIDSDLKLYVTRSGLGHNVGRYACEDHLEHQLRRQGYRIVAPETLGLAEQTHLFRSAGKLIFAEGSALHLYALMNRPEQNCAVIKRRESLPPLISSQLIDRTGRGPHIVDAIRDVFWPPVRSDHLSVSVLDFDKLGADLENVGLIDRSLGWDRPDPSVQQASICAGLADGQTMLNADQRRDFLREIRARRSA